jgi:hypothetical protein
MVATAAADGLRVGHVEQRRIRAQALVAQRLHRLRDRVGSPRVEHHVCARARKPACNGEAEAAIGAGHQRDMPREIERCAGVGHERLPCAREA